MDFLENKRIFTKGVRDFLEEFADCWQGWSQETEEEANWAITSKMFAGWLTWRWYKWQESARSSWVEDDGEVHGRSIMSLPLSMTSNLGLIGTFRNLGLFRSWKRFNWLICESQEPIWKSHVCVSDTQENCEDRQGNKLSLNIVKTQATVIGSRPKLSQLKSVLGTFFSFKIVDGGRRGWRFAVSSCFWNGLTVFGRNHDGFTVSLFLNVFQICSQNMIREVKLSQN